MRFTPKCRAHQRLSAACLAVGALWGIAQGAGAQQVETRLPNGVVATAEYRVGQPERPAVLVLHGFLQTRDYLTVSSLTAAIHDAGYSVLAPTLSLGIERRRQSLACEAVHSHTMADDVAEIDHWVQWLVRKGHDRTALVGHSSGSLEILVYLAQASHPSVQIAVATSLVDVEHTLGREHNALQLEHARQRLHDGDLSLQPYQLSYCKAYTASPQSFISYAEWSKERILGLFPRIDVPFSVVMGGDDRRMHARWPDLLRQHGVEVRIIEGANHFFNAEHEFDLHDAVLSVLNDTPAVDR